MCSLYSLLPPQFQENTWSLKLIRLMFEYMGSWETSHSFGLTSSSVMRLVVLPVLVWIWHILLKGSCFEHLVPSTWGDCLMRYQLDSSIQSTGEFTAAPATQKWGLPEEVGHWDMTSEGTSPLRCFSSGCLCFQDIKKQAIFLFSEELTSHNQVTVTWRPEALEQSVSSLHQLVRPRYFVKWCKSWVRHLPGRCVVKFRIIDINCLNTTLEI